MILPSTRKRCTERPYFSYICINLKTIAATYFTQNNAFSVTRVGCKQELRTTQWKKKKEVLLKSITTKRIWTHPEENGKNAVFIIFDRNYLASNSFWTHGKDHVFWKNFKAVGITLQNLWIRKRKWSISTRDGPDFNMGWLGLNRKRINGDRI